MHVPGPHLEQVRVPGNEVHLRRLHDLGDDPQPGFLPCQGKQLQAFLPEPLEGIGARPRLVRSPPQEISAGVLHGARGRQDLFLALDGAGPRDDGETPPSDLHPCDINDRVLAPEFPACQFVRFEYRYDILHQRQEGELLLLQEALIPDHPDDRPFDSLRQVSLQAEFLDASDHMAHVFRRGPRAHDDDHVPPFPS